MSTAWRLSDYATTPLYNIKAVVQATGISPSTLRAWERRYNMCRPQRSENGYRLYAERDVSVIRWLKAQVDAGMSISQAVSWLENLARESGGMAQVVLPAGTGNVPSPTVHLAVQRGRVRDVNALQQDLLCALLDYDEEAADQVIAEAFALYPVEQLGENLFQAVSAEIDGQRQAGALNRTAGQFASIYLRQRLAALLRGLPNPASPLLIWVACAPAEAREIDALLLSIYLRRAGYRVHYLGPVVPVGEQDDSAIASDAEFVTDFVGEMQRRQPAMLIFSAGTQAAAEALAKLTAHLPCPAPQCGRQRPLIGYGGPIFSRRPDLRSAIAGVYLGDCTQCMAQQVDQLLLERQPSRVET
ncbi:MAG: MerR family transcriptional regulator [Caldilineaceae bacterium]|nr:MerR family transcriptional regulator [Caldilineaceae bacterium]